MKNVSLYLKEGSSDKEYHIQLEKSGDGFIVNFQYGRVGNALQSGTKTPTPENEEKAIKIFDKLEKEKRAKGYNNKGEQKNDFEGQTSIVRSEMRDVVILPQLLNTIELDEVEKLINDDRYLAQEKMDGERRLIISSPKHPIGLNKKGQEVPLSNSIIDSVKGLYILDGEIIGNIVYVFDTLAMGKLNHRDSTCLDRIQALKSYNFGDNIKIVSTAITTEEKRGLYNKLKAENKEGIVFKLKSSPYTAGRPSSGGNALKFKFQKTVK